MPISFKCPNCSKQYQLKDDMAGKQARCSCGTVLKIPAPAAGPAAGDDPLSSLLDDELSQAPPGGSGAGSPTGVGGPAAGTPFGGQSPGGFPRSPAAGGIGSPGGAANPYTAPSSPYQYGSQTQRRSAALGNLPAFCMVMFILDTVFCFFRLGFGCLGVVGLNAAPVAAGPLDVMAIVMNFGIAVVGLTANTLFFMKKPFATFIGGGAVFLVAIAVVISLLNVSQVMGNMPAGAGPNQGAQQAGFAIGVGCALIVPLIVNGLYVGAIVKFAKWVKG